MATIIKTVLIRGWIAGRIFYKSLSFYNYNRISSKHSHTVGKGILSGQFFRKKETPILSKWMIQVFFSTWTNSRTFYHFNPVMFLQLTHISNLLWVDKIKGKDNINSINIQMHFVSIFLLLSLKRLILLKIANLFFSFIPSQLVEIKGKRKSLKGKNLQLESQNNLLNRNGSFRLCSLILWLLWE